MNFKTIVESNSNDLKEQVKKHVIELKEQIVKSKLQLIQQINDYEKTQLTQKLNEIINEYETNENESNKKSTGFKSLLFMKNESFIESLENLGTFSSM